MDEDKLLCGLNYKSLGFTDAQYEAARKMIKDPNSTTQLLLALLDVSSGDTSYDDTSSATTTSTCSTSSSIDRLVEEKTGLSRTSSSSQEQVVRKASSGYSSLRSINSSPNHSLESLNQPQELRRIFIDGPNVART